MRLSYLSMAAGLALSVAIVWAAAAPAAVNPNAVGGDTWVIVGPCAPCSGMGNCTCANGMVNGQSYSCPGGAFQTCTVNPPGDGTCVSNGAYPCSQGNPGNFYDPCESYSQDCEF